MSAQQENLILRLVTCRDMSTADHVTASVQSSHALGCMHSWPTTSDDLVQIPALQSQEVGKQYGRAGVP